MTASEVTQRERNGGMSFKIVSQTPFSHFHLSAVEHCRHWLSTLAMSFIADSFFVISQICVWFRCRELNLFKFFTLLVGFLLLFVLLY